MHKQSILRLWGLAAQRGWACLISDRHSELVRNSLAQKGHGGGVVPIDDANAHRNFFNPHYGQGAANSAGFGWRASDTWAFKCGVALWWT